MTAAGGRTDVRDPSTTTAPDNDAPSLLLPHDRFVDVLRPAALFGNAHPCEVDVGCGKGRFLRARAATRPGVNFLGVDRMRGRMHKLDRKLVRDGLRNVRLVQLEAAYVVERMLPPESVRAYYVFFPDPWPKRRHHRRRLFGPAFLDAVHRTLEPDGRIHVATDHLDYFATIRDVLEADPRFDETAAFEPAAEERTDFELIFAGQGKPIGRCSFRKRGALPPPGPAAHRRRRRP